MKLGVAPETTLAGSQPEALWITRPSSVGYAAPAIPDLQLSITYCSHLLGDSTFTFSATIFYLWTGYVGLRILHNLDGFYTTLHCSFTFFLISTTPSLPFFHLSLTFVSPSSQFYLTFIIPSFHLYFAFLTSLTFPSYVFFTFVSPFPNRLFFHLYLFLATFSLPSFYLC